MSSRVTRQIAGVLGGALLVLALLPASASASGPATHLVYGQQPLTSIAGGIISPPVTVLVEDAGGNVVTTDTSIVSLTIGLHKGFGTLSGTTSVAAISGVATFSDLSISSPNTYTLVATDGALTSAVSAQFSIVSAGAAPTFTSASAATFTVGVSGSFSITASGSPAPSISLSAGSLPAGVSFAPGTGTATLSGTPSTGTANTYTLTFTATNVAGSVTQTFLLTVGAGTAPAFTSANAATFTVGVSGSFAITASGAPKPTISMTGTPPSGVTFSAGTSTGTAALSGTPAAGTANTYTLTFTAFNGIGSNATQTFTLTVMPGANAISFAVQPGGGQPNVAWSQQPVVAVRDTNGNLVTTPTLVTLTIGTNPTGGQLFCPTSGTSKYTSGGYAYFSGCYITVAGAGYTLVAASSGLTSVTSSAFNIGTGTNLTFVTQPGGGQPNVAWSQQPVVAVRDNYGNLVTTPVYVTLAIGTNPGGGTLYCSSGMSVYTTTGYAYFSGCYITAAGTGYTLTASSSGYGSVTSSAFSIGTGTNLTFVTQPGGGQPNVAWSQQPVVAVRDNYGNLVTTPVYVTLAIGTNPGGGTLYCSSGMSVYTTTGYAYFSGCYITAAGTGYTLTASSSGYGSVTSSAFSIGTGTKQAVSLSQSSAMGVTTVGTFDVATKVVRKGDYITIKITTSPALAGVHVGIWIAKKGPNGTWSAFSPHTGRVADSQGTVYYYYKAGSVAWLSFQVHFDGDATHAPAVSRAIQGRWVA